MARAMSRIGYGEVQPLGRRAIRGLLAEAAPCAGPLVMGTGIVAVALSLAGFGVGSRILLAVAAVAWLAATLAVVSRTARARPWTIPGSRTPYALTSVGATCVLGDGLLRVGWTAPALALWWLGAALLCALLPGVASGRPWGDGHSFLLAVATQSVAALAATLAAARGADWMIVVALALFAAGLALYLAALARFPPSQLRLGGGEIWIAGGALAISALACGELVTAIDADGVLNGARDGLSGLDLGLWIAAVAWLPVLAAAELRWPRWGYRPSRWATVFPVGMYATCSFATGAAAGLGGITRFARVWVWIALAVWCLAAIGLTRSALRRCGAEAAAPDEASDRGRARRT
jgi:tellurite resistance protein TehA-like permease